MFNICCLVYDTTVTTAVYTYTHTHTFYLIRTLFDKNSGGFQHFFEGGG